MADQEEVARQLKHAQMRSFTDTLRDDPKDATGRLIFADRLEDMGEPDLARVMRLQARNIQAGIPGGGFIEAAMYPDDAQGAMEKVLSSRGVERIPGLLYLTANNDGWLRAFSPEAMDQAKSAGLTAFVSNVAFMENYITGRGREYAAQLHDAGVPQIVFHGDERREITHAGADFLDEVGQRPSPALKKLVINYVQNMNRVPGGGSMLGFISGQLSLLQLDGCSSDVRKAVSQGARASGKYPEEVYLGSGSLPMSGRQWKELDYPWH